MKLKGKMVWQKLCTRKNHREKLRKNIKFYGFENSSIKNVASGIQILENPHSQWNKKKYLKVFKGPPNFL
jgi:hypothetical protein